MADDIKALFLVPIFGIVGAASTLGMWWLYDTTVSARVAPAHSALACVVSGLLGPGALAGVIALITKRGQSIRWPAGLGLGMVIAAELAFYLPIGFMAVAFHRPL